MFSFISDAKALICLPRLDTKFKVIRYLSVSICSERQVKRQNNREVKICGLSLKETFVFLLYLL